MTVQPPVPQTLSADDRRVDAIRRLARRRTIKRAVVSIVILAAFAGITFLTLRLAHPLLRPAAPANGWTIDPPWHIAGFIALYLPAFIGPLCMKRVVARWRAADAAAGFTVLSPIEASPAAARKAKIAGWILIPLLSLLMAMSLVLYAFGFTRIGPDGIEAFRVVRFVTYPYAEVVNVAFLPGTMRIEGSATTGPMVRVTFQSGWTTDVGSNNGLSEQETQQLAAYVAEHAHVQVSWFANAVRRN